MEDNKPEIELPGDFPEQSDTEKKENEIIQQSVTASVYSGKPRTIRELTDFCLSKGMPLERMRFFIGQDYREPRAFGIYQSGDEFIVYKNKSDGSRAIRYRGRDEAYAVSELYEKLLDECHMRGIYPERDDEKSEMTYLSSLRSRDHYSSSRSYSNNNNNKGCVLSALAVCGLFYRWILYLIRCILHLLFFLIVRLINPFVAIAAGLSFFLANKFIPKEKFSKNMRIAILIGILLIVIIGGQFIRSIGTGYYIDGDKQYYRDNESWYQYGTSSWHKLSGQPNLSADRVYYSDWLDTPTYVRNITKSSWWSNRYFNDFSFPRIPSDPGIIDDFFRSSSDSRSGSSWDWDSWDSSDTDWDSDW